MKYRFGKATVISSGIGVLVVFSLAKSAEVFLNKDSQRTFNHLRYSKTDL